MKPRRRQVRLPFEPVRQFIGADSQSEAARALGIPLRRVHRYWHGDVPLLHADALAVAAGAHPIELWGVTAWNNAHDEQLERKRLDDHRRMDRNRLRKPVPRDGWEEIERSWRQWRNQRERLFYDRLDRDAERRSA